MQTVRKLNRNTLFKKKKTPNYAETIIQPIIMKFKSQNIAKKKKKKKKNFAELVIMQVQKN